MTGALAAMAIVAAFACGFCAWRLHAQRTARKQLRQRALTGVHPALSGRGADHFSPLGLRYAESLNTRLYAGQTTALSPSVRMKRAAKTRAGAAFEQRALSAGVSGRISASAFCEARMRLTVAGAMMGALAGIVFSTEMAIVAGVAGALAARSLPMRGLREAITDRQAEAQRHLSEMLEVVALGLRSGLTFDRSFALYGAHFDSGFARSCALAQRRWSLGLVTREDALRTLAESYECDQLSRVIETIVRSLRFGSALTASLSEAAVQARASYRASLAERVAKAPVKMMLPTGTLILPAMLLLVMGPILLELVGGF